MNQKEAHHQDLRVQFFQKLATLTAALGCSARLRIIQLLAQAPRGVEELSDLIGESVANTSQHLQRLARENLVTFEKRGTTKVYQIGSPLVLKVWESLQDLAEELSPSVKAIEDELVEPSLVSLDFPKDILRRVETQEAILLDVRRAEEAEASPISSSIAIPLTELNKRLRELPKRKVIFVFCRGRFCQIASEAVRLLRNNGYNSFRLRESPYRLTEIQGGL